MEALPIDIDTEIVTKYNLDEEQEKKEIVRHYRALLRALREKLKKGDKELLRTAFEMAAEAHKTMRRKSGEPYVLHPLAVAMICVEEIGLGVRSTICALLHDTVEDTDIALDDIKSEFGNEIAKTDSILKKLFNAIDEVPVTMVSYGGSAHNISLLVPTTDRTKTLQLINSGLFGL